MGKGQSPTPNELQFIYTLLSEGYSDADILVNYSELKNHGNLGSLPYREDIRFIRQRRKEYEAVKKVLETEFKVKADARFAKHRDALAKVADGLLSNFIKIRNAPSDVEIVGDVVEGGSIWLHGEPPPYRFSQSDRENPEKLEKVDGYYAQLLLEHLKQESSLFNDIADWRELTNPEDISDELVSKLTFVSHGGLLDNPTCEMCKPWHE